jgi:2-(1,2-epoxy-1,2-dihydrophenyl)acetyl-CoA isomerase
MDEGDDLKEAYDTEDSVESHGDDEEYDHLIFEREDGIATITMNRPERDNRIHDYMAEDLRHASKLCHEDDDIRCVVLRGTGDVFSLGLDLATLEEGESKDMQYRVLANRTNTAVSNFVEAEKPVLAGVNGRAADGGFGLALACDLLVVDEAATFEFSYPEVGLAGDCGLTFFLPRSVGRHRAREIAMLHEPIDAAAAVELGFGTQVVSSEAFDRRLEEFAERLAAEPTKALGRTKSLFNNNYERLLPDHLEKEERAGQYIVDTEDFERGLEARETDEEPEFRGA